MLVKFSKIIHIFYLRGLNYKAYVFDIHTLRNACDSISGRSTALIIINWKHFEKSFHKIFQVSIILHNKTIEDKDAVIPDEVLFYFSRGANENLSELCLKLMGKVSEISKSRAMDHEFSTM